jgi:hypothetical protein
VYLFVLFALINLLRHGDNAGGDAAWEARWPALLHPPPHLLHDFFNVFGSPARRPRLRPPAARFTTERPATSTSCRQIAQASA